MRLWGLAAGVELQRARRALVGGVVFTVIGLVMVLLGLLVGSVRGLLLGILGVLGVVVGVALVREERRPFRFAIGPEGLTLGVPGIDRLVPWTEIGALVLDQPLPKPNESGTRSDPYLILVPVPGSDLIGGRPERTLSDGRTGRLVLRLADVTQSREQIAQALRSFGGDRFTDAVAERQARIGDHEFSMVLRGYDPAAVETLIRQAADALGAREPARRAEARDRIDNASLPIVNRGYDRQQVDDALRAIAKQLAEPLPPDEAH